MYFSTKKHQFIAFSTVSAMTLLLSACNQENAQNAHTGMPPAQVQTIAIQKSSVPFSIELPATLSGNKEVEIRARVSGIIESRNFEEGQTVNKGDSLFTLDLQPFKLELEKAKAQLEAAKATLNQAKRERDRLDALQNERSVSKRDFDNAVSSYEIAVANLAAAEVSLKNAQLDLDYAQVKAPVTGIVGREFVSQGSYVQGPSVLLTEVTDTSKMRIRFGFSEREQLAMRKEVNEGSLSLPNDNHFEAQVILQDNSVYGQMGIVNFSDVRVNRNTGTSELQAMIDNPTGQLRPGQFVRVRLNGAIRNSAFVVPQKAVLDNGTGKFVYVATPNEQGMLVALQAPVEVAEWVNLNGENAWVIKSGLQEGQNVIIEGMARIFFPGMPVQINNEGA
ncbi:RND efflux system, membrane fusion protein CmeA [Pseudoalteromonas luteoviolacea B = ATCC 29581]|nr:RND efflux system, membrane fusion protein CmeA [Pseudoalteromonas luteoviolacea B = ATCC 29581]